ETVQAAKEFAPDEPPTAAPRSADRAMLGIPGLDCVDDFVKYLSDKEIRNAVQQRFLDVVLPLLHSGSAIDVISHSWGTVVAYEALRRLDGSTMPGQVHRLFTVGSALSIVPVQSRLQFRDGRRPRCVQRWVNLDARGDIVGGTLRGLPFDVDAEFLNLVPTGCDSFLGIVSPACAHSSYFHPRNTAVNRHIFAGEMEA
ncbi:MAG: hypothetical protein JJ992_16165, partial [Planctomycetes bacterium]|nr:hypothetical protein [Planctomycetota bacterium]